MTICADVDAIAQPDATFEHHVDVDDHIQTATQLTANVDPRGIEQRHALIQQGLRLTALQQAFQLGQLTAIIDAQRLLRPAGQPLYAQTFGHRQPMTSGR